MLDQDGQDRIAELVERAAADRELCKHLMENPKQLLKQHGIDLPNGLEPHVSRDRDSITLELKGREQIAGELNEEILDGVTGGKPSGSGQSTGQTYLVFNFKLVAVKTISWSY